MPKLHGSRKVERQPVKCACGWKGKRDPRTIDYRCPRCARRRVYFA